MSRYLDRRWLREYSIPDPTRDCPTDFDESFLFARCPFSRSKPSKSSQFEGRPFQWKELDESNLPARSSDLPFNPCNSNTPSGLSENESYAAYHYS